MWADPILWGFLLFKDEAVTPTVPKQHILRPNYRPKKPRKTGLTTVAAQQVFPELNKLEETTKTGYEGDDVIDIIVLLMKIQTLNAANVEHSLSLLKKWIIKLTYIYVMRCHFKKAKHYVYLFLSYNLFSAIKYYWNENFVISTWNLTEWEVNGKNS